MRMRILLVALISLCALCLAPGQVMREGTAANAASFRMLKRDYYVHLRPEHQATLKAWLEKEKPWLRPAVEDLDSRYHDRPDKIRRVVGANAHQFYAVGDFNDDGKEDFAVLLVDDRDDYTEACQREVCSAFVIFNGDFNEQPAPAYYEEELDMLDYGYIAFDQKVKGRLYFGSLEGYYFCSTLIPKGNGYEAYEDDENCGYRVPQIKQ